MALLAAYNFDEASGDVIDHGGANDWTLNTGAQRTTLDGGHTDEGLTKLGAGLATVASPAFGQTSARTFMFWLKGAGNAVWVLRWYVTGDDTGSWGLYILSGNVNLRLRKGGSNTNITTTFPGDGLWHHYAGTYDGTNSRLYLDGTLVATSGTVTSPLDTADSIQVLETSLTTQTMDDLRIYDEALDQSTIATLMGTPVGSAPPSASGTVNLTATAALSASGQKSAAGTVSLSAGAVLQVSGSKTVSGSTGLAAVAALLAGGVKTSVGSAALSAVSALLAGGGKTGGGTAALSAVPALQAGGVHAGAGVVGLSAGTGLVASGASVRAGMVTLAATVSMTAAAAGEPTETPASRIYMVPAESRVFTVPAESRVLEVRDG